MILHYQPSCRHLHAHDYKHMYIHMDILKLTTMYMQEYANKLAMGTCCVSQQATSQLAVHVLSFIYTHHSEAW